MLDFALIFGGAYVAGLIIAAIGVGGRNRSFHEGLARKNLALWAIVHPVGYCLAGALVVAVLLTLIEMSSGHGFVVTAVVMGLNVLLGDRNAVAVMLRRKGR